MNFKNVHLLICFGLFTAQAPIEASLPKYAKIAAKSLGATLVATTIAAKIATSTCNPVSDYLHKTLTDRIRKADIQEDNWPLYSQEGSTIHTTQFSFINYNDKAIITSPLDAKQKQKLLRILQAKGLPAQLIDKMRIYHAKDAEHLEETLLAPEAENFLPLKIWLEKAGTSLNKNEALGAAYNPHDDLIYIRDSYLKDDSIDPEFTHVLLHELTHHDYSIGHDDCAYYLWPFTQYIFPLFGYKGCRYNEEKRAEIKALEHNDKTCIRKHSAQLQARFKEDEIEIEDGTKLGYITHDPEFVEKFIADHPELPETCALCCDQAQQELH